MGKKLNENNIKVAVPADNLEPAVGDEPVGEKKVQRLGTPCRVHIHSKRFRLADPDGISAKAVIDGIVISGLLSDDSTSEIAEVSYSQEKVSKAKGQMEETLITMETLCVDCHKNDEKEGK